MEWQGNVIIQYFEALTKVPYVFTNFFVSGTTFPIYYSRSITRYPKRAYTYYNGDSWLFANELSMAISYVYWPDELSNMTEGKYYAECESGLYSSTSAASTCTDCAAGTYASQVNHFRHDRVMPAASNFACFGADVGRQLRCMSGRHIQHGDWVYHGIQMLEMLHWDIQHGGSPNKQRGMHSMRRRILFYGDGGERC